MTLATLAYPQIDPVALRLGVIQVRWYGLAYLAGFVAFFFLMRWAANRWRIGLSDDDLLTIVLGAVLGVVLGGRLGYVLFYTQGEWLRRPTSIFEIWNGGMSFHGGLLGAIIASVIVARVLRMPWLTLCDLGSLAAPIGLFFGRLANFVNDELWGRVTSAPWGMVFPSGGPLPRHPSQLYEAVLEGVVIFAIMLWLSTREHPPLRGSLLGWLLTLYGVFRIVVEFFRQPDVQIGFLPGGATMGQLLSLPVLAAGVLLLIWSYRRRLPQLGPQR